MTNPVSALPSAQLPLISQQLVEADSGNATQLFHRFLTGLYLRTGGAVGVSAGDAALIANEALAVATAASAEASLAETTATAAHTTANTALSTANTAQSTATSANSYANFVYSVAAIKSLNLSDLTNPATARANLGLTVYPLTVTFDTLSSGLKRYIPIVRPLIMPANFYATHCFAGVAPTIDAIFNISYIRAGVTTAIGQINFVHAGTGYYFSLQPAVTLAISDVLVIQCPNPADSTLAEVAMTFPMTLA